MDHEAVADAIVSIAEAEIRPRFRSLAPGEVAEKSPGEIVTIADAACELALTDALRSLVDAPVVGEEQAAHDPSILRHLGSAGPVWVVDPLDGTANFAAGSHDHAVMVAYLEDGTTEASWMWAPELGQMAHARRGDGAFVNGERVEPRSSSAPLDEMVGVVKRRFLPDDVASTVAARAERFASFTEGANCAGIDYPRLVSGHVDFLLYWRTLPWDHLPGALFATEAGHHAVRPDGTPYRHDGERVGLLVAPSSSEPEIRRVLLERPPA